MEGLRERAEQQRARKDPELEAALDALILELASMGWLKGLGTAAREMALDGLRLGFWAGVAVALRRLST